ncbi:MAG: enoyl-CoA hydratase/isomerase family protein [Chromatiales bacterium]|nr:enoyl-CoA hydratase/isomerase family protein [Chromatiales bacterium]
MAVLLQTRTEDGVAILTLNRPASRNAMDVELAEALHDSLAAMAQDDKIGCVVLRGAGGNFMSGGDVKYFHRNVETLKLPGSGVLEPLFRQVHGAIRSIRTMPKPVLASVQGSVAGFGVSLLAACDLALAADDAEFSAAYCQLGVTPDGGLTWSLPRITGWKQASELLFFGNRFDAYKAKTLGLVNDVVLAEQLGERTDQWALRLARGPRKVLARTKRLLGESLSNDLNQQLEREQAMFIKSAGEPAFAEGLDAFLEKRPPRYG